MADREAFFETIRNDPEDELIRLVFADWLEEHDDPLGQFIRLQFENKQQRRSLWFDALEKLPNDEQWTIDNHADAWLGPYAEIVDEDGHEKTYFYPVFRFGMVERLYLPAEMLLREQEDLLDWFPAVHDLVIYDIHGRGERLAQCEFLQQCCQVELADWITTADAMALAHSPHWKRLRRLGLWNGHQDEEPVCRAFARSKQMPLLEEFTIIQYHGGVSSYDRARELDDRATRLVVLFNRSRRRKLASVYRPFERWYPLNRAVGYGLYAGRLPQNKSGIFGLWGPGGGDPFLVKLDKLGKVLEVSSHPERDVFPEDLNLFQEHDPEVQDRIGHCLQKHFAFESDLIHVKEIHVPEVNLLIRCSEDPYDQEEVDGLEGQHRLEMNHRFRRFWLDHGNFNICYGGSYLAGPNGLMHSS